MSRIVSTNRGIAALLLNVLVWPGLGSIVGGQMLGWAQGTMALLVMTIYVATRYDGVLIFAIPIWIWGLVTGVRLIQRARHA